MENELIVQGEQLPAQVKPVSDAAAIISVIERAAMNPNVDIEKMERLFALQQQIVSRQSEVAYNEAMAQAQSEMDGVVRNKRNNHTKSAYADLDAIHAVVKPIYTKYGFSLSFGTGTSELAGHIRVTCTVRHRAGHSEVIAADFPLDAAGAQGNTNKTAIQAIGSTQTYARRYMETMVFNIALRNDNDGNSTTVTTEQAQNIDEQFAKAQSVQELVKIMNSLGKDEKKAFNDKFNVRRQELTNG